MNRAVLVSPLPVDDYPPVASHATILARQGVEVLLFTAPRRSEKSVQFRSPNVSVLEFGMQSKSKAFRALAISQCITKLSLVRLSGRGSNVLEIAYDPIGVRMSQMALGKAKRTIHHYHEAITRPEHGHEKHAISALLSADLITVADAERVPQLLAFQPKLNQVETIRNLPLKDSVIKTPVQRTQNFSAVYFGGRGPGQSLDVIIASMAHWPNDVTLHLYGRDNPIVDQQLKKIANEAGVENRVFFEGWVSQSDLMNVVAKHHIGFAILKPLTNNLRFSAGASNKRYQMMAAGLPQITDDAPSVRALVADQNVGVCVSPEDELAISNAVHEYYNSPDRVESEGERGKMLIIDNLNQEREFRKILKFARVNGANAD